MGPADEGRRDPLDFYGAWPGRACQGRLQAGNPHVPVAPWGGVGGRGLPLTPSLNSFSLRKILLVRGCGARCFRATSHPGGRLGE